MIYGQLEGGNQSIETRPRPQYAYMHRMFESEHKSMQSNIVMKQIWNNFSCELFSRFLASCGQQAVGKQQLKKREKKREEEIEETWPAHTTIR